MTLPGTQTITARAREALQAMGVDLDTLAGEGATTMPLASPVSGTQIGTVAATAPEQVDAALDAAVAAQRAWRTVPAPARGQLVARWGRLLTEHQHDLAALVTIEAGKTPSEAAGEVQEMIDICEFALGLSRQLYGKTMPSERPGHRLAETWHPLGVVGVISAFNFPVAVYSWNTAIALVAGNAVIWKPSEKTLLSSIGAHALLARAAAESDEVPEGLTDVILAGREAGEQLVDDPRVSLLSATGSVRMGREVGPRVAQRFGRSLLELGGNNGAIVAPSADQELALRGVVFSAAGTAGQRCTTLRRLFVHESIADELVERIVAAYRTLTIGNPSDEGVLVGPLVDAAAHEAMQNALVAAQEQGGEVLVGGQRVLADQAPDAYYVEPAVVRMPGQTAIVEDETFAPILYVMTYSDLREAIEVHNAVPQGLSSSIFTQDVSEAELFLSDEGSDCGIANVNIGTSGAEIGGAFGGEKETGGGRESGSDAWQAYMRRATNTVNYSGALPLAQGVVFL